MKLKLIFPLVAISFSLFSCDYVEKAYHETFGEQSKSNDEDNHVDEENDVVSESIDKALENFFQEDVQPEEEINLLEQPEKLDKIQAQLQEMFPGKSLQIRPPHIYFETDRIRLQLVDPEIPENVDWYYYQTKTDSWTKESPIKLRASELIKSIPLNDITFSTASKVYRQVLEKTETIEGAEIPTSIYFSFHISPRNWNTRIRGSRADYNYKADVHGNEMEFKRL